MAYRKRERERDKLRYTQRERERDRDRENQKIKDIFTFLKKNQQNFFSGACQIIKRPNRSFDQSYKQFCFLQTGKKTIILFPSEN